MQLHCARLPLAAQLPVLQHAHAVLAGDGAAEADREREQLVRGPLGAGASCRRRRGRAGRTSAGCRRRRARSSSPRGRGGRRSRRCRRSPRRAGRPARRCPRSTRLPRTAVIADDTPPRHPHSAATSAAVSGARTPTAPSASASMQGGSPRRGLGRRAVGLGQHRERAVGHGDRERRRGVAHRARVQVLDRRGHDPARHRRLDRGAAGGDGGVEADHRQRALDGRDQPQPRRRHDRRACPRSRPPGGAGRSRRRPCGRRRRRGRRRRAARPARGRSPTRP